MARKLATKTITHFDTQYKHTVKGNIAFHPKSTNIFQHNVMFIFGRSNICKQYEENIHFQSQGIEK